MTIILYYLQWFLWMGLSKLLQKHAFFDSKIIHSSPANDAEGDRAAIVLSWCLIFLLKNMLYFISPGNIALIHSPA